MKEIRSITYEVLESYRQLRKFPEFFDAMKCEVICIVLVMRPAVRVFIRGARYEDDVIPFECKIGILKTMFGLIVMRKNNLT